jgi:hypothetical protein
MKLIFEDKKAQALRVLKEKMRLENESELYYATYPYLERAINEFGNFCSKCGQGFGTSGTNLSQTKG